MKIIRTKRQKSANKLVFVKNAAILTVTALLLRGVGMYFRIYVSALVGAEGIGLYQLIMSVYVLASGFASSGIVVAVTRMTADELACGTKRSLRAVLRSCTGISAAMGLISAVVIASLARPIGCGWLSDERAVMSLRVMALALPFMSISCCLRGYFTARRRAGVPSAAQIVEQTVRIVLALVLINRWMHLGVAYACAAIMVSDVASEAAGCLYTVIAYLFDRRKQGTLVPGKAPHVDANALGKEIWGIAAPITASHYLTTLLRTIESILVPDCLTRAVFSRATALELFGLVKGMALPLVLFPSTLLTAFSSLLVPEISQAQTLGRKDLVNSAVRRTMQITLTLSILAGTLFLLFPLDLGVLIYKDDRLAPILTVLAPLMPLMYAESVVVGILRGLNEQASSLKYGILDSVVRILLIIITVPKWGLWGFLGVMVVSNLLTPLLHIHRLLRVTGIKFDWGVWLINPMFSAMLAFITGWLLDSCAPLASLPAIMRMIIIGMVVSLMYGGGLIATGAVKLRDIAAVTGRGAIRPPVKQKKLGPAG